MTALVTLPLFAVVAYGAPIIGLLLLAGAVGLLWQSRTWSIGEKLAATFLLPSGVVLPFVWMAIAFNNASEDCLNSGGGPTRCVTHDPGFNWGFAVAAVLAGALVVAVFLRLIERMRAA